MLMNDATGDGYKTILYEVENRRARITLNRPDKRNALSVALLKELNHALWEADADNRVRAVILRANGKDFSSGYDLQHYETLAPDHAGDRRGTQSLDDDIWRLELSQRLRMAIFDMHKPVIAQIHGRCIAGGSDLAMLCDILICADDAQIGFPPTRSQGSPPNHMWLYLLGPQWAKRMLFTGDLLLGRDAERLGLVLKSVPPEQLASEVEALVDRISAVDADLLAAQKRIVNLGLELMGARTLQRLAAEMDGRGHLAKSRDEFREVAMEKGIKEAVRLRDAPFGDGIVRP
jgi:enoyl-CoA hydratase